MGFWIFLALLVGAAVFGVSLYNGLVSLREQVKNQFSQIDVQLNRRYDLIPNLIEVAKTYMAHERDTLEAVISARNQASAGLKIAAANPTDPSAIAQLGRAEGAVSASLGRLFAVAEAYPDLKANTTMMQLTEELTATENRVAFARQAYNDSVMGYNQKRQVFPSNFVASMFQFTGASYLEIDDPTKRAAPVVKFQ